MTADATHLALDRGACAGEPVVSFSVVPIAEAFSARRPWKDRPVRRSSSSYVASAAAGSMLSSSNGTLGASDHKRSSS